MLLRRSLLAAPALLGLPAIARAQDGAWPSRPVRMVLPYAAGGATDVIGEPGHMI